MSLHVPSDGEESGESDDELESNSFPVVELRLGCPPKEAAHVFSDLRHGCGCSVVVFDDFSVDRGCHRDPAASHVGVVVLAFATRDDQGGHSSQ